MPRLLCLLALAACCLLAVDSAPAAAEDPVVVLVMDPLSAPLSCPCVAGYAQRDYDKLGVHLAKAVGQDVKVYYAESVEGLKKQTKARPAFIVGKESVVRHEATSAGLKPAPLAALTGKDGKTTQTGLIVVVDKDAALTAADLGGYTIFFGPAEADEKYLAALNLLAGLKVAVPDKKETCLSCTVAATTVLDKAKQGQKVAGVVSSYAQPLLEGCGTIKKGELRVVGETDPVPFIVAFATDAVPADLRAKVQKSLLTVGGDPDLCKALETKAGFVAVPAAKNADDGKKKD